MNFNLLLKKEGFSLVELMVALIAGILVIMASMWAFNAQHRSFIAQEDVTAMQQDARVAMDRIVREIRMTGYRIPDECSIFAIDGDGDNNSDIIFVSDPDIATEDPDDTRWERGKLYYSLCTGSGNNISCSSNDCDGSIITATDINCNGTIDFKANGSFIVWDGNVTSAGIIDNSAPSSSSFSSTSEYPNSFLSGAKIIPGVYYKLENGVLKRNNQTLAENVVQFQVQFDMDVNGDGQIDTGHDNLNVNPSSIYGNQWGTVRRVHLWLVVKSERPDPDPNANFPFFATIANVTVNNNTEPRYRYRLLESTVTLRNMGLDKD